MKHSYTMRKHESIPMSNALGQSLDSYRWTHFVTLTTRYELTEKSARRLVGRWFHRVSEISARRGVPETLIAWFCESHKTRNSQHIHLLLLAKVQFRELHQEWQVVTGAKKSGDSAHCRALSYLTDFGASYYCAKYITKGYNDWDIDFRNATNLDCFREIESTHIGQLLVRTFPTYQLGERVANKARKSQKSGGKEKEKQEEKNDVNPHPRFGRLLESVPYGFGD
jgi:hypothetical protein